MPTPFAALEARANRSVAMRLANAQAVFATGAVDVIFDEAWRNLPYEQGVPRRAAEWTASAPAEDFAAHAPQSGMTVSIRGADYTIAKMDTDPTGWMTLTVRPA